MRTAPDILNVLKFEINIAFLKYDAILDRIPDPGSRENQD